MISLLLSFAMASLPFTVQVNGQQMKEWAPIEYDLQSRSLIIKDFICDPWLPMNKIEEIQETNITKGLGPVIFFVRTGRFYYLTHLSYNPSMRLFLVQAVDSLQCQQITIFKDGFED